MERRRIFTAPAWRITLGLVLLAAVVACRDSMAPHLLNVEPARTVTEGCPVEHPDCLDMLRAPTAAEESQILWAANRLTNHWDPACQTIGYTLSVTLGNNQFQVWDGPSWGMMGDWHSAGGGWFGEIHIWEPLGGGYSELDKTLVHEGAHKAFGAGHSFGFGPPQVGTAEWWENYCWRPLF